MTSPSPPSATEPSSAQAPPDVFAILAMFDALKLDRSAAQGHQCEFARKCCTYVTPPKNAASLRPRS